MDNTHFIRYLKFRRTVLLSKLAEIDKELCVSEEPQKNISVDNRDTAIRELESEVLMIMQSKSAPCKKKELANILYEKNQNFKMSLSGTNEKFVFHIRPQSKH